MQSNRAIQYAQDTDDGKVVPLDIQQEILRAITGIEYGSVEVVIHNAKVIQIEVRKKRRFGGETKALR
ncbi:MAG TPA: YezD family protein [Burkholderiales bacterium]|nr:YezD family protein [Burkholderiales bacterium]